MTEQDAVKDPLKAMLAQYDANNKPKYEKREEKVYDLKNYFNTYMKEGINSMTKQIRILPPESGSPFVQMHGHKVQIGGEWKVIPCLKHEKDEPCPYCEAKDALMSTGVDGDKKLASKYSAKLFYIVKVIDRDKEEEGVKFWRFAHDYRKEGIYDKIIGVLNAIKKDVTDPQTGRDLLITINRNQNNAPIVSAVASLDPSVLSENKELETLWLSDKRTWNSVYSSRSYEYMEILVKGGTPVWDKDLKGFVDKDSVKVDENAALETELTIGLEDVKANITTATTQSPKVEDEGDDLPF
jgi:hypothetical protein